MDGAALLRLCYVETIIPFLGLWLSSYELHHHLSHNLLNYSETPSGSCRSGRPAPSQIWREVQEAALNQRRRTRISLYGSVSSQRGESDSVAVNTFHVAAICTVTKQPGEPSRSSHFRTLPPRLCRLSAEKNTIRRKFWGRKKVQTSPKKKKVGRCEQANDMKPRRPHRRKPWKQWSLTRLSSWEEGGKGKRHSVRLLFHLAAWNPDLWTPLKPVSFLY